MAGKSQISKACKALDLNPDFRPTVTIAGIFEGIELEEMIACLRTSVKESAQIICALFDRLNQPLRKVIDIDYLIAAAHSKDPHEIAGLITESYSRVKNMESQIIAARRAPEVMTKVIEHGKKPKGFQHARLALQIPGVAPVPRTMVQHNYMIGNKFDNRTQTQINMPLQSEVVNEVSDILAKLPQHVSSEENSGEDQGDRTSQRD